MNKTLLIAAITVLSNTNYAEQSATDHVLLPYEFQQYCDEFNTQACQDYINLTKMLIARNIPHLTLEERKELNQLYQILVEEKNKKYEGIITIKNDVPNETERIIIDKSAQ
jgi:hypothetical protein